MKKIMASVALALAVAVVPLPAQAFNHSLGWFRLSYHEHSWCVGRTLVHDNLRVRCTDGYVATIRPGGSIKNEKYV